MAESPIPVDGSVIRLSVFSDGTALDDSMGVVSVEVSKRLNRIPWARLVLLDGDVAEQTFELSSSDTFKPGAEIRIAAGYGTGEDEETLFQGIVVRHGVRMDFDGSTRLEVECRDPVVAATIGRKNACFRQMTDSDVISGVLGSYDVQAVVDSTTQTHPELVQHYCSDWDFVVARAEAAGLLVSADGGTVTIAKPDLTADAVLTVAAGVSLMEFRADTDARTQLSKVQAVSWDPSSQEVVEKEESPASGVPQGNLTSSDLAAVASPEVFRLQTPATLDGGSLTEWAKARQLRAGLARIQGRMRFQGSAKAVLGSLIELEGVGDRFNGNVFVSGVEHRIEDGGWVTEVRFGLPADSITERPDVVAPPAAGWTPGVEGLHVGVVRKLEGHPDGLPMIQVALPVLDAELLVWARLATPHGTQEAGFFFVPEVEDEVVVGFFANDPSHPVILGSLHSTAHAPPFAMTSANTTKALVTPAKLSIEFDDDAKSVTVQTPGGNSVVLSDQDTSITLEDQNGNSVVLGEDGIALTSGKDITVEAQGKFVVQATESVELTATGDLKGSGANVSLQAETAFSATGNASAELSASGQTSVKGAMVMIN